MGLRFRKSFKIAPGVRVNISKSGLSTSVGGRGLTANFSKRGTRVTASIPGTGLSTSELYGKSQAKRLRTTGQPVPATQASPRSSEGIAALVIGGLVAGIAALATSGPARAIWTVIFLICAAIVIQIARNAKAIPASKVVAFQSHSSSALASIDATGSPSNVRLLRRSTVNEPTLQVREQLDRSSPAFPIQSGELFTQAVVNGTPTFALAGKKDDLSAMVACAEAEKANYWEQPAGSRLCAAPYYFERAAILYRKAKQYASEVKVCEAWVAITEDYAAQDNGTAAKVHLGARSQAICNRLPKARMLLEKA